MWQNKPGIFRAPVWNIPHDTTSPSAARRPGEAQSTSVGADGQVVPRSHGVCTVNNVAIHSNQPAIFTQPRVVYLRHPARTIAALVGAWDDACQRPRPVVTELLLVRYAIGTSFVP